MILINGNSFNINTIASKYLENSIERNILNKMAASNEQYKYASLKNLNFELTLRKQIIKAAKDLNMSNLNFSSFKDAKCNPEYWTKTPKGGFLLKAGIKPSIAIKDIFTNGKKYATECATAMMIVYYKALLDLFEADLFNKVFSSIYLMDWHVREPLLKEVATLNKEADILLGDRGYFDNPDVDPAYLHWQGENVIILPDSMYYGHGIGVATASKIINTLNKKRKKGSTKSAYLMDAIGRPNFTKLANTYYSLKSTTLVWKPFPQAI